MGGSNITEKLEQLVAEEEVRAAKYEQKREAFEVMKWQSLQIKTRCQI
jgi:hypothetical protein